MDAFDIADKERVANIGLLMAGITPDAAPDVETPENRGEQDVSE